MSRDDKRRKPPMRHRGPGAPNEKPKDFKGSIKKLLSYLHDYNKLIVFAIMLAIFSSILAIVGPKQISKLTDLISKGLIVDNNAISEISKNTMSNLNEDKMKEISKDILQIDFSDSDLINRIISDENISDEDKESFTNYLNDGNYGDFSSLPESILRSLFSDSTYHDVSISVDDKISFINNVKDINKDNVASRLDSLPNSIKEVLLPTITVNNIKISSDDQISFIKVMSSIKDVKKGNKIYSKLDKLPKSIKEAIKPSMNTKKIKDISLFLLILYLVSALFNFLQGFIMATVSNNFARDLRRKMSVKIDRLPLKYFDNHSKGDILSRLTNDIDMIGANLPNSFSSLVGALTLFICTVVMMFITNYIMALAAIVSSAVGFIFMFIIIGKSQKYFTRRQEELGKLNGHIEEIYSLHKVVKAYNGEEDALNKFDVLNKNVFDCERMSQFLSGIIPPMMGFVGNFSYLAVCIVGAILVMNNTITFGVIVAFMIYARLFTGPLSNIAQGFGQLQSIVASFERVVDLFEEKEMPSEKKIKDKLELKDAKGNIKFEHVKFGYKKSKTIIEDFSCEVKKGNKVAIVGPTGAGKTTMVNLLMKFYDIDSGDIIIDGKSIKDLTRENIHSLFTMVLQDTWLFKGTIRDNVVFNEENVSDEEVWKALKTVGIDHFIKTLPGGLDYVLRDNDEISAGQKQLLTIARGMIKDAPFLILDEATSSVDTRTEELVQIAMDKLTNGRTSFIIAHRLSTIKNSDIILVMSHGNIIEMGNHKELIKKKGFYSELYNSQFKK